MSSFNYNPTAYLIPKGCYATNEWETAFINEDGGAVVSQCVEYSHPSHGVYGVLESVFINDELMTVEFVKYDESL